MNAPRASILVRSAPAALSTTLPVPVLPSLTIRDHPHRRPRHHHFPSFLSPPHPWSILPHPAFLPLSPTRIALIKSSCMVCHTSASASASASVTLSTSASDSSPIPSSSLSTNDDCSTPKRPAPHPSAVSFVGATLSTAVAVSVTDSTSQSPSSQPVFMDVDTPDLPLSPSQQQSKQEDQSHPSDQLPTPTPTPISNPVQTPLQPSDPHALSTSTVTTADSHLAHISAEQTLPTPLPPLAFRSGIASIPHPEKADKGGEDAFFVQRTAIGVFDGVGGWASIGVDAGLYSKELARLTAAYIDRQGSAAVVDALKSAKDNNRAIGSSTACVIGLNDDKLVGVNLGDSGLVVIRNGTVVYRTCEQQHYFNCPYQIGTDSLDTVEVGHPIDFKVQHGDWIIMGTDGLWDNVFPDKIVEIVMTNNEQKPDDPPKVDNNESRKRSSDASSDGGSVLSDCSTTDTRADDAQVIAKELAGAAVAVANDERSSSPFAVNAQNAGHLFLGGKVDDITIIAAMVVDVNQDKATCRAFLNNMDAGIVMDDG